MILPDDISYEQWIAHIFDHPVTEPEWWWANDSEYWPEEKNAARALWYMTRLFQNPAFLIDRYSRAQIDQGFDFLVNPSCSDYMFTIRNQSLPWPERQACLDAMIVLYRDLFASLYGDDLAHWWSIDRERPNSACYMWWDIIPLHATMGEPDQEAINEAVIRIFQAGLNLKSEACLESILHGMGHWCLDMPDVIRPMIHDFLRTRHDISDRLRQYAEIAATGIML